MARPRKIAKQIHVKDIVLIYLDTKRHFLVQVAEKVKFSTDLGTIMLDDIIGKPYGYVGETHLGKNFYCLRPSHADIMFKAKRLTTVVYPKDLGLMILETAIGSGSRVIDIGTGSGVMALVLARLVAPNGMVYTYERRAEFIEIARQNIERAGCMKQVTFHHWDAAEDGFKEKDIDAVFVDVPEPWTVIPAASRVLKGGHHLVSWSPNIEQVKQTVESLEQCHFTRIRVSSLIEQELLVRQHGVRPRERGITHTAYLVRANKVQILNTKSIPIV
ncbi:hypothetical protein AMJ87_08890 [candidate division WOR_3 bacterium SM23_60]|uniref:tRNA (adenine(58)-N(1))-methyltransferase TrmI n=1 Tax=candidate division WOR_3 bacterium SM23_60 TaxID=1703780 RepID=A0A0S8GCF2_UNCW3|nr:MAG: hypothetical protein AMJ87_08890 [candidate division WOR_3 bacterium SM23_60]